ncbi:hypothetical protein BDR06DRAFT_1002183 [Suillus hirtellus]|nr:hypothetical protein BDR06DRAFT_1002183 [Suillus hirtellus]
MQLFDVTELIIKIYKQLYRAVSGNNGSSSLSILWQKLPSADPLLHLLPDDVVQKQPENMEWHYTFICSPFESKLDRLYFYTQLIQGNLHL